MGARRALVCLSAAALAACEGVPGKRFADFATEAQALTVCDAGSTVAGVDVSDNNGVINWSLVAGAGNSFAIAKATEGVTYTDTQFATNWPAMQQAGLVRGAYHFFHSTDDGTAQADFFLATVGALGPTDLPPTLDWEVTDGQSPLTMIAVAQAFVDEIYAQTGLPTMIYTAPGWWASYVGQPNQFGDEPLWTANWGVSCPGVSAPWTSWDFWQSINTGSVAGIAGAVDLDAFNGTLTQLQQFQASLIGSGAPDAGSGADAGGVPDAGTEVCAAGSTLLGIDVSANQDSPDFTQVANAGYSFVIAKATEGLTITDPQFANNWSAIQSAGLVRGAYHYFHSTDDGTAQADYFLAAVGAFGATDVPPILAWQVADGQPVATMVTEAQAFVDEIYLQTGLPTIVFTESGWWASAVGQPAQFGSDPLWVEDRSDACPGVVPPWTNWLFWQLSGDANVPGVDTVVDIDEFNGTFAQLQQLQPTSGGSSTGTAGGSSTGTGTGTSTGTAAGSSTGTGTGGSSVGTTGGSVTGGSGSGGASSSAGGGTSSGAGSSTSAGSGSGVSSSSGSATGSGAGGASSGGLVIGQGTTAGGGPKPKPIVAPAGCGCSAGGEVGNYWLFLVAMTLIRRRIVRRSPRRVADARRDRATKQMRP